MSSIARGEGAAGPEFAQKRSREEYRRAKVLDEQRKAGTVPAEVDVETGRDINPHIPEFISKAPWYVSTGAATLRHQRLAAPSALKQRTGVGLLPERSSRKVAGRAETQFRPGSCENCGSMTHKRRDCLERPRRRGAKLTNAGIRGEEVVVQEAGELGYEAKRDRWDGYDGEDHERLIREHEQLDEARRQHREREIQEKIARGELNALDSDSEDSEGEATAGLPKDEDKYAEQSDMPGQKVNTTLRQTVRNLRIREDTAKYLLNLDVNSAYYDPKSRSMRENPLAGASSTFGFAGDNFARQTGDVTRMAKQQLFAWDAEERGKEVHMHAQPTQAELLHQEFQRKRGQVSKILRSAIVDKYGDGSSGGSSSVPAALLEQSEAYVEYLPSGEQRGGQV